MLVTRMVTKIVDANWCSMDRKDSGRDIDRAIGGGGGVGCCLVMISFSSKVFALSSLRVLFKVNLVAKLHLFELIPIKVEGRKRLNFQEYRNGLNIVKN
jgi:hypothetical protein